MLLVVLNLSVMVEANKILPVFKVEHNCIVSMQGDITVAYAVELPEIFTLSDRDYEAYHQAWVRAIRVLPQHSIFHKQDWFSEARFMPPESSGVKPFLVQSSQDYFRGRSYLDHQCYVFLTKRASARKPVMSAMSSLLRKSVPELKLLAAEESTASSETTCTGVMHEVFFSLKGLL